MPTSDPVRLVDEEGEVINESNPLIVSGRSGGSVRLEPAVTAGAYAAGDCVGGLLQFPNMAPTAGQGGLLTDAVLVDDAGQDAEMELWLFVRPFTSPGDNNAFGGIAEDDLEHLVGIISTADGTWRAAGTPSAVHLENVNIRYILPAGTTLYGQLVTRGTPTFVAVDDVSVRLNALFD